MTSYKLKFTPKTYKQWHKLGDTVREQLRKKLQERLEHPRVPKDRLSGFDNLYKIKLKSAGYRLVYEVKDDVVVVLVLSIGKREKGEVYAALEGRIE